MEQKTCHVWENICANQVQANVFVFSPTVRSTFFQVAHRLLLTLQIKILAIAGTMAISGTLAIPGTLTTAGLVKREVVSSIQS